MALTPRGVALANLIDLYATSDMNLETRHQLCILLVEQVNQSAAASVIEPGLQTLRTALAPLPASLRDEFDKRLLETTEPDDLWDLMGSLNELLQPTLSLDDGMGPIQLERSSMLGLYVRRLHLAFRSTSFEELCTLVTHFGEWVHAASTDAPTGGYAPPAHIVDVTDPNDGAEIDVVKKQKQLPPPWAYVLPPAQLEAHVHALARMVEEGSASTTEPKMAEQIRLLLHLAPHVPQVHYLQLLHHLHTRSYEEALESFHRYFDLLRAASGGGLKAGHVGSKEATRAPTQWASLNLARLQLSFCQREQAMAAIQEAVRSAQQQEDNVCLAYSLLWIYHAQAGSGADAWGCPLPEAEEMSGGPQSAAASAQRQQALLQRCLSRAHELGLPELAALASQALALTAIDVAATALDGAEPVTPPANPEPTLSVGRAPCLPPVPLALPGALPAMPSAQPPPLHAWESLRCGAEGCGGSVQLVRATAWERFGESRLASMYAGLQLKFHRTDSDAAAGGGGAARLPNAPAGAADGAAGATPAAATRSALLVGPDHLMRASMFDRVLAACKLAVLSMGQHGEHHALATLLSLRPRCEGTPPLHAIWLQHTGDVLVRGALLRGERRRATELIAQQQALLAVADGPTDATWEHELELLLQEGETLRLLLRADEMSRKQASGKGAGAASPRAMLLLMQAKAHAKGGEPLSAIPHALSAMALAERASLLGLHAAAALELASAQLSIDAPRALELLQKVRAHVMRNGSAYEVGRLQLLTAECRLAMLPPFDADSPPQLEQLQPHILPALADALVGFGRLRCHAELGAVLYTRARIWHSVGSLDLRDRDARAFARAERDATHAASRPSGLSLEFGEAGALEAHMAQLKSLDTEAASMYSTGAG